MPTKQKSGLYRSKVKIGVDANGKDVVKYISGHTKRELEQHRQEVIDHYINGNTLNSDRLFGEYAMEWYRVRKAPFVSHGTQAKYRSILNKHILPEFGNRKLRSIRPLELQSFLQRFDGMSSGHIKAVRVLLNEIFSSACQDHILETNPAQFLVNPKAKEVEDKPVLDADTRAALERTCSNSQNGAFLAVLYYLGLRLGEASGLKWGDFDWAARMVHIQRKVDFQNNAEPGDPKTKRSNRLVPIPDALYAILFPLRQLPDMYLFHGKDNSTLKHHQINAMYKALMADAGLVHNETRKKKLKGVEVEVTEPCPNFTAHTLRHNYVTMCIENGLDPFTVSRIVGHDNISTTLNIYTHMTQRQLAKAHDDVNEMFQNKSCTKVAQPPNK